MTKRQDKGTSKGGQFAPDTSGKKPPAASKAKPAPAVKKQAAVQTPDAVKATHAAYKSRKKVSEQNQHDPLCPWRPSQYWRDMRAEPQDCQCELIAQVRAEDAEQEAQTATSEPQGPVRNGYQFAPEGECSFCDQQYAEGNSFFPPHRKERKPNCGGGSNFHHCTCSACF